MKINEMKKRPILTMLSGPAASVMGSLMYLRASNGIYFEVGGTTKHWCNQKWASSNRLYCASGHKTYVNSLDVRVTGVAGGSMVRANKNGIIDVGPRSAHIAGLDYAVYSDEDEIIDPQIEFFSPKPGDPADYVAIRCANGKRLAITTSCAANVLGLVKPHHFSYGNVKAAIKAMKALADYLGVSVEEAARQILQRAYEKLQPLIQELIEKYRLEPDQISFVGVGGGASALIALCR